MQIYPGVHISNGKAVNLKAYGEIITRSPVKMACQWENEGATYLHLIDVDGATSGYPMNEAAIKDILGHVHIPVQYGGGLRSIKDIDNYLNMGVERVVISTKAVQNPNFIKEAVNVFGADRIVVSIDTMNGMVTIEGREKVSNFNALTLALNMERYGVNNIIYTNVSKVGSYQGADVINALELIKKTRMNISLSGGIGSVDDLDEVEKIGAHGVVIGTSIYTQRLKLSDIIKQYERGIKR